MVTVLVTIFPVLPALSTYRYSNRYVHTILVFTIHELAIAMKPLPSTLSIHSAQPSE